MVEGATDPPIRRLRASDAGEMAELDREVFGKDAWPPDMFDNQFLLPWVTCLGIDARELDPEQPPDRLAACGVITCGVESDLMTIAVREPWRRRGLATALLSALLAEAERQGAEVCFLEVRAADRGAQALYRRAGFTEVGIRRGYYGDDDGLLMRRQFGKRPHT
ncbi:MAG: GNAT family N-acetyltransferase [Flaviflexus sp.]|nr:GNAT family N-acetyltransferase [Flaviflexus sp.]